MLDNIKHNNTTERYLFSLVELGIFVCVMKLLTIPPYVAAFLFWLPPVLTSLNINGFDNHKIANHVLDKGQIEPTL